MAESKRRYEEALENQRKVEEKKLKEKLVTSFPNIKSNDNLEVAHDNFEEVLIQAEIPENEWLMYLRTVLTGKYLDIIHTMRLSADASFQTVKQKLLQASEYTMTNAGDQLMNADRYQLKHLSALDLLLHFERLIKRLLGGLDTIAEPTHVLSKIVIRNYLCVEGKKYLDSREIVNQADLLSALQSFRAITITAITSIILR